MLATDMDSSRISHMDRTHPSHALVCTRFPISRRIGVLKNKPAKSKTRFCFRYPTKRPSDIRFPDRENIHFKWTRACPSEFARNRTHPRSTKNKVYSQRKNNPAFLLPRWLRPVKRSRNKRRKNINPHAMKVKLAPCHRPVNPQTIRRFIRFRPGLIRLPPKGI